MGGVTVQSSFRAFVARHQGAAGRAWLDGLPALEREFAEAWQLKLGPELDGGLLACVREATTAEGERVVLKLAGGWDLPAEEAACLVCWGGVAAPRLLRSDVDRGALLLERVDPGTNAIGAEAADVAGVLRSLHGVAPPPGVPDAESVVRARIDRAAADGRANAQRVGWALAALARLGHEAPPAVLLHGDFDDRNLLHCHRRGLVAIDPLPCIGDPAYDAGYWAHANRRPGRRARWLAISEATGLDPRRVRDWAAIVAVHG